MITRIQEIINIEKLTPSAFADEIGITRGAMNHILNGRNKPSLEVLLKIVYRYKNINLDWLIQGTPPMYKSDKAAFQPDLFVEKPINPSQDKEEEKYSKEINNKDKQNSSKPIDSKHVISDLTMSENIDKIVIFFKNKTFITLKPED